MEEYSSLSESCAYTKQITTRTLDQACGQKLSIYLDFEGEIFFHVLHNHDQIWQFNSKSFSWVSWTSYIRGANIWTHNFEHKTLNIRVSDSFDMSISHFFVPNLQWFTPNAVQDRQEPRLKGVLEHAGVKIQSWYIKSNFGFVLVSRWQLV